MEFIKRNDNLPISGNAHANLFNNVTNMEMKIVGICQSKMEMDKTKLGKGTDMTARGTVDIKVSASFTILVKYVSNS